MVSGINQVSIKGQAKNVALLLVLIISSLFLDNQPTNAQESDTRSGFSIESSTPFLIGTSVFNLGISSELEPQSIKINVLRSLNSRSQLFDFFESVDNRRIVSTFETAIQDLPTTDQNRINLEIPINDSEVNSLQIPSNGVYPLAVTLEADSKSFTQYTFVTYVSSVNEAGQTFDAKLSVAPLIKFEPFVNRLDLFDTQNNLTNFGLRVFEKTSDASETFSQLNGSSFPSTFVLSPEAIELNQILNRASNIEQEIGDLIPLEASASVNYIADIYSPTNFSQVSSSGFLPEFDEVTTISNQVLNANGYNNEIGNTLITKAINTGNTSELIDRGFTRVIADRTTFPNNAQPSFSPIEIRNGDDETLVAPSDDSIIENMPAGLSDSSKASFILAGLSVVALESPSIARGYIVPLNLYELSPETMLQVASGLRSNPLAQSITLDEYFNLFEPDQNLSQRINRLNFPSQPSLGFSEEELEEVKTTSRATMSMFEEDSTLFLNARWYQLAAVSDSTRNVQRVISAESNRALIESSLDYIALPESRTLTLTSRETSLPVTLRNTSNTPITVTVQVSSNRLAFPEGSSSQVTLADENTTVQIPVIARTSGVFPITISLVTPKEEIEIIRESATVRSTAFSGVGIAIAALSLLFLAFWWISHHKKTKKQPVAQVLSLTNKK